MTTTQVEDLTASRRAVRAMAIGIMPSAEYASAASAALRAFAVEGEAKVRTATEVAGFIAMGVAPSLAKCQEAALQIDAAIEEAREAQSRSMRERYS